jgi:hypothetical protein
MDLAAIKIAEYSGQRIWMVRAEQGRYFSHFRENSVISIGHLDKFYDHRITGKTEIPADEIIRSSIVKHKKYRDEKSKSPKLNGSGNKFYNQILHFIHDIKKGDIVLTLNSTQVMVGVCQSSKPILRSRELKIVSAPDKPEKIKLSHRLRKHVEWGPIVDRRAIGGLLSKPFRSQQTVVKLNDFWKEVFGLIYPFFSDGKNLHFSTYIGRHQDINGKVVSKFFDNLSNVQVIANEIFKGGLSEEFVERLRNDDVPWDLFALTAKAHFMSQGAVYSTVPLPPLINPKIAARIVAMLFLLNSGMIDSSTIEKEVLNGTPASDYTPSTLVDERSAARGGSKNLDRMLSQLVEDKELVDQIRIDEKVEKVKDNLKLSIPQHNTSMLEDKAGIKFITVAADEK